MLTLVDLKLFGWYLDQEIRDLEKWIATYTIPPNDDVHHLDDLKETRVRLNQTMEALINESSRYPEGSKVQKG